jgi:hypothetical protein
MVEHLICGKHGTSYFRNAITAWSMSPPQATDHGGAKRRAIS